MSVAGCRRASRTYVWMITLNLSMTCAWLIWLNCTLARKLRTSSRSCCPVLKLASGKKRRMLFCLCLEFVVTKLPCWFGFDCEESSFRVYYLVLVWSKMFPLVLILCHCVLGCRMSSFTRPYDKDFIYEQVWTKTRKYIQASSSQNC